METGVRFPGQGCVFRSEGMIWRWGSEGCIRSAGVEGLLGEVLSWREGVGTRPWRGLGCVFRAPREKLRGESWGTVTR